MTKTKVSSFDETPEPRKIVPFYSKNALLSEEEWFRVQLLNLIPSSENEPLEIRRERARLEVARKTLEHFRALNLAPIFSASDYEALKLLGEK
jgi:hypothetical protein